MAYHDDTGQILIWLGYSIDGDFSVRKDSEGNRLLNWFNTDPEDPYYYDGPGGAQYGPTAQDILDQVVPWKKSVKLDKLDTEYLRRVELVNSHIASGGLDGLEWAESTLKASREVAETVGKQILEWVRNNSALNPPDSVADISGPDFVTALRTQTELDQILDLRTAYIAAKAAINALTTEAELDAYDVTTTPEWPV